MELLGRRVFLAPLRSTDLDQFAVAALSSPEVWRYLPFPMRTQSDVEEEFANALRWMESGSAAVFLTRLTDTGELAGGTALIRPDPHQPRIEIGGTWLLPRFQRTGINLEVKYLQLTHCFEKLGCVRVEFKTDARNESSRASLRKLGAKEEGILRRHMRMPDGVMRDSVYFSILDAEWPAVKRQLERRLRSSGSSAVMDGSAALDHERVRERVQSHPSIADGRTPQTIETPRLLLRMFVESDWDALSEMFSDAECVRYTVGAPLTHWQTWRTFAGYIGHWQLRGYGPYAVVEKATGRMVGPVGLWCPGDWPEPEIKWSLARRHWGNGYATEAALAVKQMAARTLGWQRLISLILPENVRSKAVCRRLGGVYEKTVPFRGTEAEIYVYSL